VVTHAEGLGCWAWAFDEVEVLPGRGVRGQVRAHAGSQDALHAVYELSRLNAFSDLYLGKAQAFLDEQAAMGATVSALVQTAPGAVQVMLLIAFTDQLKPQAADVVQSLQARGLKVWILSGDQAPAVQHVAQALNVPLADCHPGMKPEDKANRIAQWRAQGQHVAFVGDGINDAPALAAADVGVAMANAQGGSDVVLSTAGMTLLRGDLSLIPQALSISALTLHKIRQNLFWAFAYNVAGIPLAALGVLSPMVAGGAMALSSVSVMLNSAALRRARVKT